MRKNCKRRDVTTHKGESLPGNTRSVKKSRVTGLIHKSTNKKGRAKLMFNKSFSIGLSWQYLNESKCIFAIRNPGNVKIAPI